MYKNIFLTVLLHFDLHAIRSEVCLVRYLFLLHLCWHFNTKENESSQTNYVYGISQKMYEGTSDATV